METKGFINPYNFVSLPGRNSGNDPFRDALPNPHGVASGISGSVTVEFTALTPLLLPVESPRPDGEEGPYKETQTDAAGHPLFQGSSFKGALRSAYEAITNSRYGTFDKETHSQMLAGRDSAEDGSHVEPAVVKSVNPKNGRATIAILKTNKRPRSYLAAKMLVSEQSRFCRSVGVDDPRALDGEKVVAIIAPGKNGLRVKEIAPTEQADPLKKKVDQPSDEAVVEGIIHWTDSKIGGKKNERLFITSTLLDESKIVLGAVKGYGPALPSNSEVNLLELAPEMKVKIEDWDRVIQSYRDAAEEFATTISGIGSFPGTYADPEGSEYADHWKLKVGRTLWYSNGKLSPSMISREPFDKTPWDLIKDTDYRPAERVEQLSAADRVFGWTSSSSNDVSSYKAQVSVGSVVCVGNPDKEIIEFDKPLKLAVLNGAKTSSHSFYVANGKYKENSKLRGRKFYVTHRGRLVEDGKNSPYWDNPDSKSYKEYMFPESPQDEGEEAKANAKVASSIGSWVNHGTTFRCTIYLHNLDENDAAALVWLLDLSNNKLPIERKDKHPAFLLGLGKPLGFGATRLSIVHTDLHREEQMRERYAVDALIAPTELKVNQPAEKDDNRLGKLGEEKLGELGEDLKSRFDALYRDRDAHPGLYQSVTEYLLIAHGFGKKIPVHYPRLDQKPAGKQFEWWQESEGEDKRLCQLDIQTGTDPLQKYPSDYGQ